MNIIDIIAKKRDGGVLSKEEIDFFIKGIIGGTIADYQASAALMAICINGMDVSETADLTMAMMRSGCVADLSAVGSPVADKHSTGGVGDTVTLIALPLAAACGCKIVKMSGRSLGHTGGTVDKMNSIGMRTSLSIAEMIRQTREIGVCVAEQSGELAPADGILYKLRDVTATVPSIPLIASSVLSKKFATGADAIVLDIKCGSGALLKTPEEAEKLAKLMAEIGKLAGRRVSSLVTDMRQPLGNYIGNRLEAYEAVKILSGEDGGDLLNLSIAVAKKMTAACLSISVDGAERRLRTALENGKALEKLEQLIAAQGGEYECVKDPQRLVRGTFSDVLARKDGYYFQADTEKIGRAAQALGAGRLYKTDEIDGDVGIIMKARLGNYLKKGQPIATLVYKDETKAEAARRMLLEAVVLSVTPPPAFPLIYKEY